MYARIDLRYIVRTAGLEEHRVTRVAEHGHQRLHVLLQQWFTACNLDQGTPICRDGTENVAQASFDSLVKGVLGIAVAAAQVAVGKAHKNAWPAGPGTLALDGVINFVDCKRLFALGHVGEDSC